MNIDITEVLGMIFFLALCFGFDEVRDFALGVLKFIWYFWVSSISIVLGILALMVIAAVVIIIVKKDEIFNKEN